MNKWPYILISAALLWTGFLYAQPDAPEIVIEIQGPPSAPRESVSVWDKNAQQLTKLFRKKDRSYVLYQVDTVSSKDEIISAEDGTQYAYVRYGSDDGDYRKFLFKAQEPQRFVACAANIEDVLAINKKYQVNLGVDRRDFVRRYEKQAALMNLTDQAAGKTYQVYKLNYSDINHKKPTPHYFVFEEDSLIQTYAGEEAYSQFLNELSQSNQSLRNEQKKREQARQAQLQKARQESLERAQRPVRKALVSGGTIEDQMYMPRAVNATPLPALTPSKIPAGTPLPTP